jgi:hypothetical protein
MTSGAAAGTTRVLDSFEESTRWECHEAGSQWETDVQGTALTDLHVTEGSTALRVVFDPERGHGKGQISRPFPQGLDLSDGARLLVDVHTDTALILRADIHDANNEYVAGQYVILEDGTHRDVALSLLSFPRERLGGVRRLSLSFTGHEPDSVLVFDNLRIVARGDGDETDSPRRSRQQAVDAMFRGPGNVVGGATVNVSSIEGPSTPASAAIDESHDTRWASTYRDDEWLELHFTQTVPINQVALHWETAFAATYRVLAQKAPGEWIELATIDDGRGGIEVVTFDATETDALRLEFGKRATVYGFSLFEIAVRHDPSAEKGLTRIGGGRRVISPVVNFRPADRRGSTHAGEPVVRSLEMPPVPAVRLQPMDLRVDMAATWENPYDPDDISVVAEFTPPSGQTRTVPGFYYWPFERHDLEGQEQLVAGEAPEWRVRFTPTEPGAWGVRVRVTDRNGSAALDSSFNVTDSPHPGFVRVSTRNPHVFSFDDGSSYFPIGLNLCWYADHGDGNRQTLAYDEWLENLAASGGNFIRVWMFSISFNPEWSDTGLGQYDERQPALWRLDHILRRCEELGIKMQLVLVNHGQLSLKVNSEWDSNPYNAANGGPLSHPSEFFADETARGLFQRRLRYLMARYSYSPNILAWEWFNEIEWTDGLVGDNLGPWIDEMSGVVREWDPNDHLFTISSLMDDRLYLPPSIDFVQPHAYEVGNWPPMVFWLVASSRERFGKPVFLGEIGMSHTPAASDMTGHHLHTTNWASLTGGAAGGAMSWWWDGYIAPRGLWHRYRGISAFVRGEQLDAGPGTSSRHHFRTPDDIPMEASSLDLGDRLLVWLRRTDATTVAFIAHDPDPSGAFPLLENVTLPIRLITERGGVLESWDSQTGELLGRTPFAAGSEGIPLPAFRTDIGVKLLLEGTESGK